MSDWMPLLAALVAGSFALGGAFGSQVLAGHREDRRRRDERLDAYRSEQRSAIGRLMVALDGFGEIAWRYELARMDEETVEAAEARVLAEQVSTRLRSVDEELTTAVLIAHGAELSSAIREVGEAYQPLAAEWAVFCDDVRIGNMQRYRPPEPSDDIEPWTRMHKARTALEEIARRELAPTIVAEVERKRRGTRGLGSSRKRDVVIRSAP